MSPEAQRALELKYVRLAALIAGLLAILPALYAGLATPPGARYLGFQYNTDDHMVYTAWMRQAMDGHFLFDNRFTTDTQPGLTVHLYFWALGLLSKVFGLVVTSVLARALFSALFVFLLYRLLVRIRSDVYTKKLALTFTVLGGGLGFLVWHNFGDLLTRASSQPYAGLMLGRQPVDIWQPEAFVFPSMLTSSLFMVSLCLMLTLFISFLSAKENWKRVPLGALAMLLLMNIHSYDVLIVAMVMIGYAVVMAVRKELTMAWLGRSFVIAAGAIPSALWFVYVLRHDPTFQARAIVPTYAPNFHQIFFGYLPMFALALAGWFKKPTTLKRNLGIGLFLLLVISLFVASGKPYEGYFASLPVWLLLFATAVLISSLLAEENLAVNLVLCWAMVGLVAPYLPVEVQRKFMMGLSIPWALLGTLGFAALVQNSDRSLRNLTTVLTLCLLSASSVLWLYRELYFIRENVSRTTVQPVYLGPETNQILQYLADHRTKRTVLLALPGIPAQLRDANNHEPIPDQYATPIVPDLNCIASGFAGVYTYAGHWGETPNYLDKRNELLERLFLDSSTPEQRAELLAKSHANYILAPNLEAYPGAQFADLTGLGKVVVEGSRFLLIEVNPASGVPR